MVNAVESSSKYPLKITFRKNSGLEKEVTFKNDNEELTNQDEPWTKGWFLKSYFQGWSDKENIADPDAKIYFPNNKISELIDENGKYPKKLYSIYMSSKDSFSNLEDIAKNNSIEINRKKSALETFSEKNEIIYEKNFDANNISKEEKTVDAKWVKDRDYPIELQSRFTMDKRLALVTFLNTCAASGYEYGYHTLTNQYNPSKEENGEIIYQLPGDSFDKQFSQVEPKDINGKPMTFVDLIVELDERIEVPENLTITFKSYNFQPYYVMSGDKSKVLFNVNPFSTKAGITSNLDTRAVKPGNPNTTLTFKTEKKHSFVLRTGIRNKAYGYGEKKLWPYYFTIINPDGNPSPDKAGDNSEKLATYLNAKSAQEIFDDMELNAEGGQLKIPAKVAKDIADGKERIVVKGKIQVMAVAGKGAIDSGIKDFSAANLNIGFVRLNTVTFDENYTNKPKDKKVKVEPENSINKDNLKGKDYEMVGNPSREGYTFMGWNTKSDGSGEKFDGDTKVLNDITVYAIWGKTEIPKIKVPTTPETPKKPETPETPKKPETPETLETPEIPKKTETPIYQEFPKKSENSNITVITNSKLPRTGSGVNLIEYGILLVVSTFGLILIRRNKTNKNL